jgi:hypothetical protein
MGVHATSLIDRSDHTPCGINLWKTLDKHFLKSYQSLALKDKLKKEYEQIRKDRNETFSKYVSRVENKIEQLEYNEIKAGNMTERAYRLIDGLKMPAVFGDILMRLEVDDTWHKDLSLRDIMQKAEDHLALYTVIHGEPSLSLLTLDLNDLPRHHVPLRRLHVHPLPHNQGPLLLLVPPTLLRPLLPHEINPFATHITQVPIRKRDTASSPTLHNKRIKCVPFSGSHVNTSSNVHYITIRDTLLLTVTSSNIYATNVVLMLNSNQFVRIWGSAPCLSVRSIVSGRHPLPHTNLVLNPQLAELPNQTIGMRL